MKKLFVLFVLVWTSLAQAQPAFVKDSLDTYIERALKQWNLPGLAIAIVKDGKVVVSKGYGVRETGKPGKVDENSLFMIASCSKAFTATSLSLLESEKKLKLDDSVTKWLPYFKLNDPAVTNMVTIRDLLCHRIGLETFQGDFVHWDSNLSREDIIKQLAKYKAPYGFRTKFGYCNTAFLAAGEIIPKATGTSWDDFVQQRFFTPLGMTRTSTIATGISGDANACKPHSYVDGKMAVIPYDNVNNLGPAGSINSSVNDLSHWIMMQLDSGRYNGKTVVPFSVIRQTRQLQTPTNRLSPLFPSTHFSGYGLGWFLNDYGGKSVVYHDGGAGGFISNVTLVPEEKLGIVVLTNSDMSSLCTALRYQIMDAYLGLPYRNYSNIFYAGFAKDLKEIDADRAKTKALIAKNTPLPLPADAFCGTYTNPQYGTMTIARQGALLVAKFEHHPQLNVKLFYLGDNKFLFDFGNPVFGERTVQFSIEAALKKVTSFDLTLNAELDRGTYTFTKQ